MGSDGRGVSTIEMTRGPGSSRSTSRTIGCAGLRSATSPSGEISDLASAGKRLYRPSAIVAGEYECGRAGPEPPGHPPAHLRDPGDPIGDFFRAFQEQGQRASGPGPSQRSHPRHALGVERAGRHAIDRFGREAHHAALRQTGDGAMDDIADVVGLRHVDPLR